MKKEEAHTGQLWRKENSYVTIHTHPLVIRCFRKTVQLKQKNNKRTRTKYTQKKQVSAYFLMYLDSIFLGI